MIEATTWATQALFLGVSFYLAWATIRSPRRSNYFALAFFALLATAIAATWLQSFIDAAFDGLSSILIPVCLLLLAYVLLRLAAEFSSVGIWVQRLSELGLAVAIALMIYPGITSLPVLIYMLFYFVTVATYASRRFAVAAIDANGISRMRFRSLSIASVLLGVALLSVLITLVAGGLLHDVVAVSRQLLLKASALLYFAGFSPPVMLRRAWQEPELRRFLHETRDIPRKPDERQAVTELERICAEAVGAPYAAIGIFDEQTGLLRFRLDHFAPGDTIAGRAFVENRPILSLDAASDDPENTELYERNEATAVLAAPIVSEGSPVGVLTVYSPNPPIFVEDDLSLLTLLADQIGVLLENRQYIQTQAELAAREESTRLKDEFLSLAAHDLKTPLTTILATGQYLERRLSTGEEDSPEMRSITRLNREAIRLRKLVEGLLDASRIERGQLITNIEPTDLSSLVADVVERATTYGTHDVAADIPVGITADCDPLRIQQVVENLLENALKYSPAGSTVTVQLTRTDDSIEFAVTDQGWGIDAEDLGKVFDRYYRTLDAQSRTAQGIGLGLYICKEIVRQHEGSIWVESEPEQGSTFRFTIPQTSEVALVSSASQPLASEPQVQEH